MWTRNQFGLTGFLQGRYFCFLKLRYVVFVLDYLRVLFNIRVDNHLAPILECLLRIILLARGSIIVSPVRLSLRYITFLNGWILILIRFLPVSIRLGEIRSTYPFNKIVFSFSRNKDLLLGTVAMGTRYHQRYDLFTPYVSFFPNLMPIFPDDLNPFCF